MTVPQVEAKWDSNSADRFFDELGTLLQGRPCTVLLPALVDFFMPAAQSDKNRPAMIAWAKQKVQKGKYPALAADLYACLRLCQENPTDDDHPRPTTTATKRLPPADYHDHFRKLLGDAASPLGVRLMVAAMLCQREGADRLPLPLAHDIARLYVGAVEKDTTLIASHQGDFLRLLASLGDDFEA